MKTLQQMLHSHKYNLRNIKKMCNYWGDNLVIGSFFVQRKAKMMQSHFIFTLNLLSIICLLAAAVQDAKYREVSNWISIAIVILAALLMLTKQQLDLSGMVPGAITALLYVVGFDKHFRGGDIKLLAALGLYLSLYGCLVMLFIASIAALLYEGCRYLITHEKRTHIPFCTWMGIAGSFILAVQMI